MTQSVKLPPGYTVRLWDHIKLVFVAMEDWVGLHDYETAASLFEEACVEYDRLPVQLVYTYTDIVVPTVLRTS